MENAKRKLEILNANYWEHFKFAKDLAGFLDFDHPKRRTVENKLNSMVDEIHTLTKLIENKKAKD